MTPVNLEELEALESSATIPPWCVLGDGIAQTAHITRDVWSIPKSDEDLALIVALRNNAKAMIQELRELRAGAVERDTANDALALANECIASLQAERAELVKMNERVNFNFECMRGELLKREAIHAGLLGTVETLGAERDTLRAELEKARREHVKHD